MFKNQKFLGMPHLNAYFWVFSSPVKKEGLSKMQLAFLNLWEAYTIFSRLH